MKLTRRTVIGNAVAGLAASAGANSLIGQGAGAIDTGQQFFQRLLKSSNASVERMLKEAQGAQQARAARGVGRGANVAALAAAYCAPESSYYKAESLIPLMESGSRAFADAQHADRTLDAGNLASPPDTGFVVEGLATVLAVLRQVDDPRLAQTKDTLGKF